MHMPKEFCSDRTHLRSSLWGISGSIEIFGMPIDTVRKPSETFGKHVAGFGSSYMETFSKYIGKLTDSADSGVQSC